MVSVTWRGWKATILPNSRVDYYKMHVDGEAHITDPETYLVRLAIHVRRFILPDAPPYQEHDVVEQWTTEEILAREG